MRKKEMKELDDSLFHAINRYYSLKDELTIIRLVKEGARLDAFECKLFNQDNPISKEMYTYPLNLYMKQVELANKMYALNKIIDQANPDETKTHSTLHYVLWKRLIKLLKFK